jgi:hypothetical protein
MPVLLLNTFPVSPANNAGLPSTTTTTRRASSRHRCRAEASSSSSSGSGHRSSGGSWASDYDLYELLGVERSSPQSAIKAAYRSLQKRCHPDVAGAAGGHDMAVVLNEVYALLSDPAARLAYDQELARQSEFAGYTGRPLYSSWHGPEAERMPQVRAPRRQDLRHRVRLRPRPRRGAVGRRRGQDPRRHRDVPRRLHLVINNSSTLTHPHLFLY